MVSPFAVIFWVSNFLRLSHHHEQLIKATITEVSYDNIMKKIKPIFSNETEKSSTRELQIKVEQIYYTKETTSDEDDYDHESNYDTTDKKCNIADTYYTQDKYRRSYNNKYKQYQNPKQQQHNFTQTTPSSLGNKPQGPTKGRNPLKNGQPTHCNICQSINHWATQCPDKNLYEVSCMVHEIILQNSSDTALQILLYETSSSAVLDSGASSTVCGTQWFNEYTDSLSAQDKSKVTFEDYSKPFRFGDGK